MTADELLKKQLQVADDVSDIKASTDNAVGNMQQSAEKLKDLMPITTTELSEVSFASNAPITLLQAYVDSVQRKGKSITKEVLLSYVKDPVKRSKLFSTFLCNELKNVDVTAVRQCLQEVQITMSYDEYKNYVVDTLGITYTDAPAEESTNGFFSITPKEGEEALKKRDTSKERKTLYVKNAIKTGLPKDLVERAAEKMTDDVDSYEKFEELIDSILNEDQKKEDQEKARDARLIRALKGDLDKLWSDKNPARTLRSLILKHYNTTAVTPPELCIELEDHPEIKINVYRKPIYSIIHQIEKPFVAEAIDKCLAKWVNNEVIEGYINSYLESLGVPEAEYEKNRRDLVGILPDSIKSQNAPDAWKQFEAVSIIMKRNLGEEENITEEIYSDTESAIDYSAKLEQYVEDGVPLEAAQRQAAEDYCHEMPEERQISMFGKVGQFAGRAIRFKYEAAADMESLMRESLGEYADTYFDHRAEIKQRKEELRKTKQELKQDLAKKKIEAKYAKEAEDEAKSAEEKEERAERKREEREMRREERESRRMQNQGYNSPYGNNMGGYGNSRYQDSRFGRNTGYNSGGLFGGRNTGYGGYGNSGYGGYGGYGGGGNFAPRIPAFIIAILIHLVIGLISFLVVGGAKTAFLVVGLAIATFGFIKKQMNEPNSLPMIIGGYAVTILAIVFIL